MTNPSYMRIKERKTTIPEEPARKMVQIAESEKLYPWTLAHKVEQEYDTEDAITEILRPLALNGVLTPTSNGRIKVLDEERLEDVI